jgi:hypothetical protein
MSIPIHAEEGEVVKQEATRITQVTSSLLVICSKRFEACTFVLKSLLIKSTAGVEVMVGISADARSLLSPVSGIGGGLVGKRTKMRRK